MWANVVIFVVGMLLAVVVGSASYDGGRDTQLVFSKPEFFASVRSVAVVFLTFGVLIGRIWL